ncbi:hypothetical protein F5888DRAFT_1707925 [Russula emetica]|nr:hypothetical protein F5888DRAFT_1707925 [Russula emetica]
MTQWRQMYDSFDYDRDGSIDASELGSALAYYNLHVGSDILDMTVRKYEIALSRNQHPGYGGISPRPQLDLDGFVCACVVVRSMFELYERCSAGGQLQISRDEFLRAVISLPSGGARGPDAAYPVKDDHSRSQQGSTPQRGGFSRTNDGAYPGGFERPDNITSPSIGNLPVAHSSLISHASPGFPPSMEQDECRAWFIAIDQDEDGVLSFDELRSALLNNGGLRFSVNTVRYLMSIFDRDGNGVIDFEEFEPLWNYSTEWRKMFDSFDVDRDGRIDASGLRSALAHYHLNVSPYILDMTMRKYGIALSRNQHPGHGSIPARPQMNLDGFVCACVVVRSMLDLYERCSTGRGSQISRDEFLRAVISLP